MNKKTMSQYVNDAIISIEKAIKVNQEGDQIEYHNADDKLKEASRLITEAELILKTFVNDGLPEEKEKKLPCFEELKHVPATDIDPVTFDRYFNGVKEISDLLNEISINRQQSKFYSEFDIIEQSLNETRAFITYVENRRQKGRPLIMLVCQTFDQLKRLLVAVSTMLGWMARAKANNEDYTTMTESLTEIAKLMANNVHTCIKEINEGNWHD